MGSGSARHCQRSKLIMSKKNEALFRFRSYLIDFRFTEVFARMYHNFEKEGRQKGFILNPNGINIHDWFCYLGKIHMIVKFRFIARSLYLELLNSEQSCAFLKKPCVWDGTLSVIFSLTIKTLHAELHQRTFDISISCDYLYVVTCIVCWTARLVICRL